VTVTRRDVFVGLSASAVAAGVWTSAPEAQAADIIQRQQRNTFLTIVKNKLREGIAANTALIPDILRLALNDAMTYEKESKSGGSNGSVRLELNRPENKGLEKAISFLGDIKKSIDEGAVTLGGDITWADLIQIAAQASVKRTFIQAAVRKCGGDEKKGEQLYTAYGSTGQWSQFDKLLGRADASEADPEGRVLDWETASPTEIKERFAKLNIKPRQIAVLSAFLGPDQAATEAKLAADPEFAPWIKKYQQSRETVSQTDYEVDLITIFTRLSVLGQSINYEAYSYKPKGTLRF
jgi:L-ascorbate peroxidase